MNGDDKSGGGFVGLVGVGCGCVWDMALLTGRAADAFTSV